jgi:hypothetical protein
MQQGLLLSNHEGLAYKVHPSSTTFWMELQEKRLDRNATLPPWLWTKVTTSGHLNRSEITGQTF